MLLEVAIIMKALPLLQHRQLYSVSLPNAINFSFGYPLLMKVRPRLLHKHSAEHCFPAQSTSLSTKPKVLSLSTKPKVL
jgi:hypothetical protein